MSALSKNDQKLLILFVITVALGSLGIWYPKAKKQWTAKHAEWQRQEMRLQRERAIIALRPEIEARYADLRDRMPVFPEGKSVDTYWLPIMDNTAAANNVNIAQRAIGGEENLGDVTELTLECRDWEGRLDSLVWFLYDLETRKDAMMDVRALTIKPNAKKPGILQGSFTLNCAYMRQAAE
ncbi:MAG: hypothetical protein IKW23_04420 [Kiritimatiellae bacterium]|nr:hypothetical protein [Kiritimatiellia bacterium]MBR4946463.1 hypothetical protein [Kiritimatiellia bacterium]MBR5588078.1 hypothetical protein [Kiritimatiellia bacterium]